jgi:osmotically-inducible protein OsmY
MSDEELIGVGHRPADLRPKGRRGRHRRLRRTWDSDAAWDGRQLPPEARGQKVCGADCRRPAVVDELQVRLLVGENRKDADLRGDILRAMALDSTIPATIEATVVEGYVTLKGTAAWQYQREEAEAVAGKVEGIVGIDNFVRITTPELHADDVQGSIEKAFSRNAKIDANDLTVITHDSTVELEGTVRSWSEHDAALAAAWAAPGVLNVEDRLVVAN